MATPYVGEIRMFGGNFAPLGWNFCDGSLLPISEYETLFNLIGTTYGGDGQQTFAVPDLRGRLPVHMNSNHPIGQSAGTESVTLTVQQIPAHTHVMLGNNTDSGQNAPSNNVYANTSGFDLYFPDADNTMNPAVVTQTGHSQPHDNMMPYLCVSFIISLFGIFPTPT